MLVKNTAKHPHSNEKKAKTYDIIHFCKMTDKNSYGRKNEENTKSLDA